jgi:lipoyl-dependent peroxiredoxin
VLGLAALLVPCSCFCSPDAFSSIGKKKKADPNITRFPSSTALARAREEEAIQSKNRTKMQRAIARLPARAAARATATATTTTRTALPQARHLSSTAAAASSGLQSRASAQWRGGLKDGAGQFSSESGALTDAQYTFATRFAGKGGAAGKTNPEEMVAAAHASCFSMALSAGLEKAGFSPESVSTTATTTLEQQEAGFAITKVHLEVRASVPGADKAAFDACAADAKAGCPISRLLNAEITLSAALE